MSSPHHCGQDGHEQAGHIHDHSEDSSDGLRDNLFKHIDRTNVVALNAGEGLGPEVIKAWNDRNNDSLFLQSEEDNEMIIRVPFIGSVNLYHLLLKTGATENARMSVSLYANEDSLDFQDTESKSATQTFNAAQGTSSIGEYTVMRAKFYNISSIALHFHVEDDLEPVQVYFLGFLGHRSEHKRAPVITVYEAHANMADHEKIQGLDGMHHGLR